MRTNVSVAGTDGAGVAKRLTLRPDAFVAVDTCP